jgi:hypothetical protein
VILTRLIEMTIGDFLAKLAAVEGHRDALVSMHQGVRWTYAELIGVAGTKREPPERGGGM